ncbi:DUF2848 family protein [Nocardia thraciensis]
MVPKRGAHVPAMSGRQIAELRDLRGVLERHAASRALAGGKAPLAAMRAALSEQESLADADDDQAAIDTIGDGSGQREAPRRKQEGTLGNLLAPAYWLDVLAARGEDKAGTVLISGTISMLPGVDQFGDSWRVEMTDPATGDTLACAHRTVPMAAPIG